MGGSSSWQQGCHGGHKQTSSQPTPAISYVQISFNKSIQVTLSSTKAHNSQEQTINTALICTWLHLQSQCPHGKPEAHDNQEEACLSTKGSRDSSVPKANKESDNFFQRKGGKDERMVRKAPGWDKHLA